MTIREPSPYVILVTAFPDHEQLLEDVAAMPTTSSQSPSI
jgi:hypothetical protein